MKNETLKQKYLYFKVVILVGVHEFICSIEGFLYKHVVKNCDLYLASCRGIK